ncbi:MAG: 30S ribosomal protein S4 [Candidatus Altiarchaeales archaeon WOR_SM1_86-2]|nr:MAG: 30S ribosomal protein S4 [Candidatus Altiarchaeales archaeon WOR_SM1_79]ODS38509.1 MAG: 30S ribosomal protein S4 [Candidatus Altiarchaeales archaeon WOR_SM1_86-2]
MGDPRKQRRMYSRPKHPWTGERIGEENKLQNEYGLKNKSEIWKAKATVGRFRTRARELLGSDREDVYSKKRERELMTKLNQMGLLDSDVLEDVLSLKVNDLLERRLQTMVYRKGLANTIKQARQFVTHGHVAVGDNVVNVPSYPVLTKEEDLIKLVGVPMITEK